MTHSANLEIPSVNFKKPAWSFYLSWIVLTVLSIPIAYFFSILILKLITNLVGDYVVVNGVRHISEDYLAMYILIPVLSVFTGALQFALLRQYLPRMGGWVLVTVAGWFLGAFLIVLPGWLDTPFSDLRLIFLLMGFAIGASQWSFLRRRLTQAGWWIVATAAGWGVLGLLSPANNSLDQFGLLALGFFPACATAAGLAWLLSRGPQAEHQRSI